ncbi:MAG: class I SAM-dependent methyltransferase [Proteobacteria bacterium]|nr:class I SAM-dependent methyltransferase [Pseudomonadota bacterium]
MSVPHRPFALVACLVLSVAACASAWADRYDDAVAHSGRSAKDLERDGLDHPAEVLRLTGIGPHWKVGDYMAGNGYYSELLSYLVGPSGHVYLLNNRAYDDWSEGHWKERIDNRLPNVEHRTVDFENIALPTSSLDALVMVKVFHDLYWVDDDPSDHWPKFNTDRVLREIARVVKPNGVLLVVDHSAKAGTGSSNAGDLHRIDEEFTVKQFEHYGFRLVSRSDVLRRADDPRDAITYKGPMVGKTDRFVLVFRRVY